MSASEWAALVAAAAASVATVALLVAAIRLARATAELRRTAREFRTEAIPALDALRHAVRAADYELDRIDAIVTSAELVTDRADSASRAAYRTLANPVVKVVAVGTGTRRVLARLRRRDGDRRDRDRRPGDGDSLA